MKQFRAKCREFFPILVMLVFAVTVGIAVVCGKVSVSGMLEAVSGRPWLAALVLLCLYALKGITSAIVFNVLVAAGSLIFDLPAALAVSFAGLLICVSVSYLIGRLTKTQTLDGLMARHPKMKRYFSGAKDCGFLFSLVTHLVGLPLEMQGIAYGILRVPYRSYLLSTFLAVAPGIVCVTVLGTTMDLRSPLFWGSLAIDAVMVLSALFYARRHIFRRPPEEEKTE